MDFRTSLVAQNYAANRTALTPQDQGENVAIGAARDFMTTLQASESAAVTVMTEGSDPHVLVHALAQTELAVQTAVAVRDKVVQAYQEILRMPI